jgi:cell fate (sporulation/competence/biofilm development) regulator YmcA (YheA/YmcA/DUF963 family)
MKKITTLSVFDFDGTLIDSPMPDTGRTEYEQKTGKPWPYQGWWGRAESLDINIFDIKPIPSVIADYRIEKADSNALVIMLTGRMEKLSDKVMAILKANGLEFDGYYFNRGGSTDVEKIRTLNKVLDEQPSIKVVKMWDDRLEHIPIFEQWGKEKVESGVLEDFNITVIPAGRH